MFTSQIRSMFRAVMVAAALTGAASANAPHSASVAQPAAKAVAFSQAQSNPASRSLKDPVNWRWSAWKTFSKFSGLDFRVKRGRWNPFARKYTWYVQFRNRYGQRIHFSYRGLAPSDCRRNFTRRWHIDPCRTHTASFLVSHPRLIRVIVGKVRFGRYDQGRYQ